MLDRSRSDRVWTRSNWKICRQDRAFYLRTSLRSSAWLAENQIYLLCASMRHITPAVSHGNANQMGHGAGFGFIGVPGIGMGDLSRCTCIVAR